MGILPRGTEIMLSKCWYIALAVLGLATLDVGSVFASGHGAKGACAGGRTAAGCRTGIGSWGTSAQFLRAENGIFGPTWAYGNTGCGWSGVGYGWGGCGYGWGYGYGGGNGYGCSGWGIRRWCSEVNWKACPILLSFPRSTMDMGIICPS